MPKKKYYQGGDDRKAESHGMSKGYKSKDMMPMYSSDMAAMPQQVVMREYAHEDYMGRPEYADTYSEKNREYDKMVGKIKKQEFHGV